MTRTENAANLFSSGRNCAQSVFAAFEDMTGIKAGDANRIAYALGGGMGRTNNVCGAYSGALLVIGALSKAQTIDNEEKERVYAMTRGFTEMFVKKYGTTNCGEILGYDISRPDQAQKAKEAGLFRSKCPEAVRTAVEILERTIR